MQCRFKMARKYREKVYYKNKGDIYDINLFMQHSAACIRLKITGFQQAFDTGHGYYVLNRKNTRKHMQFAKKNNKKT